MGFINDVYTFYESIDPYLAGELDPEYPDDLVEYALTREGIENPYDPTDIFMERALDAWAKYQATGEFDWEWLTVDLLSCAAMAKKNG